MSEEKSAVAAIGAPVDLNNLPAGVLKGYTVEVGSAFIFRHYSWAVSDIRPKREFLTLRQNGGGPVPRDLFFPDNMAASLTAEGDLQFVNRKTYEGTPLTAYVEFYRFN